MVSFSCTAHISFIAIRKREITHLFFFLVKNGKKLSYSPIFKEKKIECFLHFFILHFLTYKLSISSTISVIFFFIKTINFHLYTLYFNTCRLFLTYLNQQFFFKKKPNLADIFFQNIFRYHYCGIGVKPKTERQQKEIQKDRYEL